MIFFDESEIKTSKRNFSGESVCSHDFADGFRRKPVVAVNGVIGKFPSLHELPFDFSVARHPEERQTFSPRSIPAPLVPWPETEVPLSAAGREPLRQAVKVAN